LVLGAGSRFGVLGAVLVLASGCGEREPAYEQTILAARAEKDRVFKGDDSPLKAQDRGAFTSLLYFPPDPAYRVGAVLEVAPPKEAITVTMPTSTGKQRELRRIGRLEFNLKGQALSLTAFAEADADGAPRLFVPFGDLTNGTETYPAGRYLDLDPTPTGLYDLDFNKAYNPFCAYNETYDCPYPPKENRLPIPVRAGEKIFAGRAPETGQRSPEDK
jgi:uncharacterized protein (DUF1684 family)